MKKLKAVFFVLMMVLILGVLAVNVFADEMTLNISSVRPFSDDDGDGEINDVYVMKYNALDNIIFKIGELISHHTGLDFSKTLYCLRFGLGFGNSGEINDPTQVQSVDYTKFGDMKQNTQAIINYYTTELGVNIDNQYTYSENEVEYNFTPYNSILWLVDNMAMPGDEESINELLTSAGITIANAELTIDDIDVVQQAALWVFSNYDQNFMNGMELQNILEINGIDLDLSSNRAKQIKKLYRYLVNTAKKNGATRPLANNTTAPTIELNEELTQTVIEKSFSYNGSINSYYVVGPFKVDISGETDWNINVNPRYSYKKSVSDTDYTSIRNGLVITIENGAVSEYGYDIKEGGEFYVAINKNDITGTIVEFKLDIIYTYSQNIKTASFWIATEDDTNNQPVIMIERDPIGGNGHDDTVVDNRKPDFALRKYITEVKRGNDVIAIDSRIPENIDINAIATSGTARYKHLKTPVQVQKDDIITYTIAVYNEGNLDGRVTQIKDYLPEGLEFLKNETVALNPNPDEFEYILEGNVLTINLLRRYNLPAFNGEELKSTSIKIVCKVNKTQSNKDVVLTNIAEIASFWTESGKEDRDSTPNNFTMPSNLEDYYGNAELNAGLDPTDENSYFAGLEDDDDFEKVFIKGVNADFALRKYITAINNEEITSRIPDIEWAHLRPTRNITVETTAIYKHIKEPVEVKPGDKLTYTITVYNEGSVEGKVTEITDYLPEGIVFDEASNPDFIAVKEGGFTLQELETYKYSYEQIGNKLIIRILEDYTLQPVTASSEKLDSKSIEIVCKVEALEDEQDQVLTNIAEITEYEPAILVDRDSTPDNFEMPLNLEDYYGNIELNAGLDPTDENSYFAGLEDDDDFEKVVIKGVNFDLSLRKFISSVKRNGEEILTESREPVVDVRPLQRGALTASYTHSKAPLVVKNGDIITYTIRVYNEGELAGYANEIIDHIPEGLEFILDSEVNTRYMWQYVSATDINSIATSYWSKERTDAGKVNGLIPGYNGGIALSYKEVKIEFKVIAPNTFDGEIVNIAEITNSVAVNDNNQALTITDRDSTELVDLSDYELKPAPQNSTYQEDDDDYEIVELKYFDLALRKFITAVNDTEITSIIPEVEYNEENDKLEYVHPKTPIEVNNADLITYTIRVYNEGKIAGFAELISDDIPEGLIYLPLNEINREYRWKMIDENGEETENISEAVRLTTDYLSEANGENMMQEGETVNPNLINGFNGSNPISNVEPYNPDFRDVKIVFQVSQEAMGDEVQDRIIINHAEISEDSDEDEDSTPDEWIDTDDDQDIEKIYVRIFDLSLQKWVTETIVTVDGTTTTTETGFMPNVGLTNQEGRPNSENEPVAQVVVDKKKIDSTEIKFVYSIRVANEGEIPGYATEITDYIPEGLSFNQEDNPLWTKVGEDKITTNALEESLLNPGESVVLEVVFTWINSEDNLGVKKNIAAITGDFNDYGDTPDIDSNPENIEIANYDKEQQDDDDYALVVLALKTGGENSYIALCLVVIAIIGTGVFFIKRFVL